MAASASASSSAPLRRCSCCGSDRAECDYSGAQLKRKGKRVCRACVEKAPAAGTPAVGGAQSDHSAAAAAAAAAVAAPAPRAAPAATPHRTGADDAAAAPVAAAGAAAAAPPSPSSPVPPAPSNPHFPGQSPCLWDSERGVAYYSYSSESQLPLLTSLIEADLSEPYSVFTYRYFLNFWPHLTFMVQHTHRHRRKQWTAQRPPATIISDQPQHATATTNSHVMQCSAAQRRIAPGAFGPPARRIGIPRSGLHWPSASAAAQRSDHGTMAHRLTGADRGSLLLH